MQCIFLDLLREQKSNGDVLTNTKDCKAGFTNLTLDYEQVDTLCETNSFLKCPRFQARVMINQGNLTQQTQLNDLLISKLKLPCIFSDIATLEIDTESSAEHSCHIEFEKFKPKNRDFSTYCNNEHFLECSRFQAKVMIIKN